jgi:hypothetical protein
MKATLRDGAKIALSVLGRRNKKEEEKRSEEEAHSGHIQEDPKLSKNTEP